MNRTEWSKPVSVAGRLLLALLLVFSQSTLAGQHSKAKEKPDTLQKTAVQQGDEKLSSAAALGESRDTGRGSHEGIKVHGHWTIEVRNPDGKVVTHREFENALSGGVGGGAYLLSQLLARQISSGNWYLNIGGFPNQPCLYQGSPNSCTISEPNTFQQKGSYLFETLAVSASSGTFVLSGTAVAGTNGSVNSVSTNVEACAPTNAPGTCAGSTLNPFGFTIGSPSTVNVTIGQTIAVTVVISFS